MISTASRHKVYRLTALREENVNVVFLINYMNELIELIDNYLFITAKKPFVEEIQTRLARLHYLRSHMTG